MGHRTYLAIAFAGSSLLLACSSDTSSVATDAGTSDGGSAGGGAGLQCPALRDKQAAANCPKFDGSKYLTDCQATESSVPAACKAKLTAFANCILGQPIGCTDAGTINDDTPPACKTQENDLVTCK